MTRRDFINVSSVVGSALMLGELEAKASSLSTAANGAAFQLLIFATKWGYTGSWDQFCAKIKNEGYDGAEIWLPEVESRTECFGAFGKYNLKVGLLVGNGESSSQKNFEAFNENLRAALQVKPVYVNCHSGKDYFTFDENKAFIELTIKLSRESKIPVYHETHRGRILYSAPIARRFIEAYPEIGLTLDISHWCNVHESLLADQAETVSLALGKVGHIHARIGHPEGPQVNDPRAPEWKNAVESHFAWWDKVVERKKRAGETMTFLTEFGPIDYLPSLPYTRQPVANQDEINLFMLKTLRARYA